MSEPREANIPDDAVRDIRPVVGRPSQPFPLWIGVVAIAAFGIALFLLLESQRRAPSAPATDEIRRASADSPPPLYIPPPPAPAPLPLTTSSARLPEVQPPAPQDLSRPAPPPPAPPVYAPAPQSLPPPAAQRSEPARQSSGSILVIDSGEPLEGASSTSARDAQGDRAASQRAQQGPDTSRARAGAFANRSTTVVQGSLISAVLESALDTTRSGFARAIVSRDVHSFDGTRVLIPRGSRLIGEYSSEVAPGQNRALVAWTRLIRPDGATIAIDSPIADTLGRTGVRARVNTHFLERFGGAILQSALNIGANVAARAADSPTVIALPGSFNSVTAQTLQPTEVTPTLSVKAGTSISVFVARDLDFTGVESGQ